MQLHSSFMLEQNLKVTIKYNNNVILTKADLGEEDMLELILSKLILNIV